MKQFLLALALIALPVCVFSAAETWVISPIPVVALTKPGGTGGLSPDETMVGGTVGVASGPHRAFVGKRQ